MLRPTQPAVTMLAAIAAAALALSGCGPSERDRDYVRAMRPIVVQYAELAGEIGNNMPEDFAMFSTNIEDLRRQAIMVYPPSGRRLRRFNTEFIDLLRKAKKAGFTFGTVFLDCEEQANAAKDYDGKVSVADKWRWEARESSKDYVEAHQRMKPYMQKAFEYPVGDIDLKEEIDALAKRLTQ